VDFDALARGMDPASETSRHRRSRAPSAQCKAVLSGLSGNGNTAVVAGIVTISRAAWVFTRSDGVWTQRAKLVGTGAIGYASQGNSVSLSGGGGTATVGGRGDHGNVGAAWVYAQPVFAGTPGTASCYDESVSALSQQYGGLDAAAAALEYSGVSALHDTVLAFCEG
jgi:hypothetical protein